MICRQLDQGWEIIYQRNHALLAAEMLADWRPEQRPHPWVQLLNACAQHDHGWQENDGDALVNEQGHPVDFLHMPMDTTLEMSRTNLTNADSQSHWCAILVSRHAEYLYSSKDDEETQAYVEEVKEFRAQRMKAVGVTSDQVEKMYELLCWADTLSLLVCCQPSEFTRSLELNAQGQEFKAVDQGDEVWTLSPWPYESPVVKLDYEVRHLPQSTFASSLELRQALDQAKVSVRRLELRQDTA